MEGKDNISCKAKMDHLRIVVIVPAYNNDTTLRAVVEDVKEYSKHVIVVNDGSTDRTAQILEKIDGIQILTHEKNKGKGCALKNALLLAKKQEFRYAITIDSDGQHFPSDIPVFVEEIENHPDWLLIGSRDLAALNMPGKNSFANKFSNFWFWIETGIKLQDTQSGYRLYPLHRIGNMKYYTTKYEFELELIVFSAWKGVGVKNIPVNIYYPPQGERISHFRPFRDFTRISILNTVLVIIAFLWIYPMKFFKNLTWKNIKAFIDNEVLHSNESNLKLVQAIMLGIFMGIVPIWGYQMIATVFLAAFFKLNKIIALVASNISIPPMMPFLLFGSYATGCFLTGSEIKFTMADVSIDSMKTVLYQYLLGSIVFAALCSIAVGIVSGLLLFVFRKKQIPNT